MSVHLISPAGLTHPVPYHHVAISTGTRQVHVAGQVARDAAGTPVAPSDLSGQAAQALRNVSVALAGGGAAFTDVVRLTVYVTQWHPDKMPALLAGFDRVSEELSLPSPLPPLSLIGVEALFEPDVLVEVEATAVLA